MNPSVYQRLIDAYILVYFFFMLPINFAHFAGLFFGTRGDMAYSKETIQKLTIPKDSLLRKIILVKENKFNTPPGLLYINAIPFVAHSFIFFNATILLILNEVFLGVLIPKIVFLIIAFASTLISCVYTLIRTIITDILL